MGKPGGRDRIPGRTPGNGGSALGNPGGKITETGALASLGPADGCVRAGGAGRVGTTIGRVGTRAGTLASGDGAAPDASATEGVAGVPGSPMGAAGEVVAAAGADDAQGVTPPHPTTPAPTTPAPRRRGIATPARSNLRDPLRRRSDAPAGTSAGFGGFGGLGAFGAYAGAMSAVASGGARIVSNEGSLALAALGLGDRGSGVAARGRSGAGAEPSTALAVFDGGMATVGGRLPVATAPRKRRISVALENLSSGRAAIAR